MPMWNFGFRSRSSKVRDKYVLNWRTMEMLDVSERNQTLGRKIKQGHLQKKKSCRTKPRRSTELKRCSQRRKNVSHIFIPPGKKCIKNYILSIALVLILIRKYQKMLIEKIICTIFLGERKFQMADLKKKCTITLRYY